MTSTDLQTRPRAIRDVPLHRHPGFVFDGAEDGVARPRFDATPEKPRGLRAATH